MDEANRFRLKAAAAVAGGAVVLVAAFVLFGPVASHREARLPEIRAIEPRGMKTEAPAVFHWDAATGATVYRLVVSDRDTVWPLAVRETEATAFTFTDDERRAWSARRSYAWQVEALATHGAKPFARGEAFFAVDPPTEWEKPAAGK